MYEVDFHKLNFALRTSNDFAFVIAVVMKAIPLLLFFILHIACSINAQVSNADDWNRTRLNREQNAMKVLFIWGNVNLGTGIAGAITADKKDDLKWFSVINAGFGAVNMTLAGFGLRKAKKDLKVLPTLEDGYRDLRRTRNILLVNVGLDAGYIVSGILLKDQIILSKLFADEISVGEARKQGFGASLIVQGSALLIFDSITAWSLSKSEIHISPVLTTNGAGIGFQSNLEQEKPVGIAWF